jgi:hypothetical protein
MKQILFVMFLSVTFFASGASAWEIKKHEDMMTDEVRNLACGIDSGGNEICFQYDGQELWVTITLGEQSINVFAANRLPILRIDKNKPHDANKTIKLERSLGMKLIPRQQESQWLSYRLQTEKKEHQGMDERNPQGIFYQLINGNLLKIRLFIHGGYQKDSKIKLPGLPDLLEQLKGM